MAVLKHGAQKMEQLENDLKMKDANYIAETYTKFYKHIQDIQSVLFSIVDTKEMNAKIQRREEAVKREMIERFPSEATKESETLLLTLPKVPGDYGDVSGDSGDSGGGEPGLKRTSPDSGEVDGGGERGPKRSKRN